MAGQVECAPVFQIRCAQPAQEASSCSTHTELLISISSDESSFWLLLLLLLPPLLPLLLPQHSSSAATQQCGDTETAPLHDDIVITVPKG
jgi:hypothetical protein